MMRSISGRSPEGWLEAHQDVAAKGFGGEQSVFGPGAADIAVDLGQLTQDGLDAAEKLVGFSQRSSHGRPIIEDERPFVHLGHEARFQMMIEPPSGHNGQERQQDGDARKPQARAEQPFVAFCQHVINRPGGGHRSMGEETGGQNGNDRQADDHRNQQGNRQRQAQRLEELAHDSANERQRHEHEDCRERRADHGPADFLARPVDSLVARLSLGQMPGDVFHHDDRIVDDQPDGHRQAAQRHQVQRVAGEVQEDEGHQQAQGDGRSGDGRGAKVF
jgi:hypothetical protein